MIYSLALYSLIHLETMLNAMRDPEDENNASMSRSKKRSSKKSKKDNQLGSLKKQYKISLSILSKFFELTEIQFELILNIMAGNPHRIYHEKGVKSEENLEFAKFKKNIEFDQTRTILVSEALGITFSEAQKLGLYWIYCYDVISKGNQYISHMAENILGVPPEVLDIIRTSDKHYPKDGQEIRKHKIRDFLKNQLVTRDSTCKWAEDLQNPSLNKFINEFQECLQQNDEENNKDNAQFFKELFSPNSMQINQKHFFDF